MSRVIWLVFDSFGIGGAPDAKAFGDEGSDTFGHIAKACFQAQRGALKLPNLSKLGLPHAYALLHGKAPMGFEKELLQTPQGIWGYAQEQSCGKDTPSGHWESMGVILDKPFGMFPDHENTFPKELLDKIMEQGQLKGFLGNCHASGTEIIQRLGEEHLKTGFPIFYTSADSVFQIAVHEELFGLQKLDELCRLTRQLLEPYFIGRVIARPFLGNPEKGFFRSPHRHDYSLTPPKPTLFDKCVENNGEVIAIGKIADIFANQGISKSYLGYGHDALFDLTLKAMLESQEKSIIATNFVDFDSVYGHRRDIWGYAQALEALDQKLPLLLEKLKPNDLLLISADHGCDPTWVGSDHTRECISVLGYGPQITAQKIGGRQSFADIGQSMATHLGLPSLVDGVSFVTPKI